MKKGVLFILLSFSYSLLFSQDFPSISETDRIDLLTPNRRKIRMVLDTDTYNEIDDQFAMAYALLSEDKLTVEAIYAAPYFNDRSESPSDGMEKKLSRDIKTARFYEQTFRWISFPRINGVFARHFKANPKRCST